MEPLTGVLGKVLADAATRAVFEAVAKRRTILLRDLKRDLNSDLKSDLSEEPGNVSTESVEHSLSVLKNADLIRERPAPISDFSTFYVTANGLNAAQALKDPKVMSSLEFYT